MAESNCSPPGWPSCDPTGIQVMLLGTYHMDNPGLDELNLESDDVLTAQRQAELESFATDLARWNADRIAVERPYSRFEAVNSLYDEYRSGERRYDVADQIEPLHPFRDETDTECRSEVVQLGFRVADELSHERVYPVDYPARLGNDALDSLRDQGFEPDEKVGALESDPEQQLEAMATRLQSSTISEFHRWLNQEEQLGINDESLFGEYIRWGTHDNFGGPRMLSTWYDRNIRIVHNVWRTIEPDDERVLLLIGNGHVPVLRHLFATAPMFCPVSPLPYW